MMAPITERAKALKLLTKWPITLDAIRAQSPCAPGWSTLLASLGDGAFDPGRMVTLGDIAVSNGAADALWCARCLPVEARRDVVRAILPAVERASAHTSDDRVDNCICVLRRWIDGQAHPDELRKAEREAWEVWGATWKTLSSEVTAEAAAAEAAARAARTATAEGATWAVLVASTSAAVASAAAAAGRKAARTERARQVEDIVAVFGRLT